MLVRVFNRKHRSGSVPVFLNVYDVTPINGYAYWLGLGIYHSGIQVHGVEYAYGAHDHPTTGIFEVEPRKCPGFRFRRSILLGRTDLCPRDVRSLVDSLASNFTGDTYHLITKNCNHFCNEASLRLTSLPIPRWVNRLANLGFFCNCVLPLGMHVVTSQPPMEEEEVERRGKVKLIEKDEKKKKSVETIDTKKEMRHKRDGSTHTSSSSSSCSRSSDATNQPPPTLRTNASKTMSIWRRGRGKFSSSSSARAALVAKA